MPVTLAHRSPLHDAHLRLGARLVPFGGWEMPLAYPSGTLAEHRACRGSAAAFDVSHLGTVRVEGAGALDLLQDTLSNDLARIAPGRAQYTQLLNEHGGVVDDIIVLWLEEAVFDVMPNASNTDAVRAAVGGEDTTASRAVIAVQGPEARRLARGVLGASADVARFHVTRSEFRGHPVTVSGTGYTGEDGIECTVPAAAAGELWEALLAAGVTPAGLGARDTLRLEAGLPLHGHELTEETTPLEAGLAWSVGWGKAAFRGRDALLAQRERGPERRLVGITTEGRQPPREGSAVLAGGRRRGTVTSGNFSPSLGVGIALAYVDTAGGALEPGAPVEVEVRGRPLAGAIAAIPFVTAGGGGVSA